jgi:hypothetical protein
LLANVKGYGASLTHTPLFTQGALPPGEVISMTHIRPGKEGEPTKTPLRWEKVLFSQSGFGDNLQLLPEDRLVLEMKAEGK